jgi:hypothetical protein
MDTKKKSTPPAPNPREVLRQKLRDKIGDKRMGRQTKQIKKKIIQEEMTKMGIDMEKFNDALKVLNKENSFELLLTKK